MSRWLTDLAYVCRTSGLRVIEVDGWRTRGHGPMTDVQTIVCHHTATPDSYGGDYPSLAVVRDGRPGLDGPLAQLGLGRSGSVYVIAAGVSYHAGVVKDDSYSNWHSIGIEGESAGAGKWTPEQLDAWPRLNAALCRGYGVSAQRVLGHKDVCAPVGRKVDPAGIDTHDQQDKVARILAGDSEGDDMFEDDDRALLRTLALNEEGKYAVAQGQRTVGDAFPVMVGEIQNTRNDLTGVKGQLAEQSTKIDALAAQVAELKTLLGG